MKEKIGILSEDAGNTDNLWVPHYGTHKLSVFPASFIGKSKLAIIATIQVPVTASLNTNFNTDGSCATASGWLAIPRPNANVSPITRIFRSLNPALEIIFIPLIRIIPKTVMIAPPSTAFGIAEKNSTEFCDDQYWCKVRGKHCHDVL